MRPTSSPHRWSGPTPQPPPKHRRLQMTKLSAIRKTFARSFTATLAVAAMAVLAGSNAAKARDQQATDAQMDNEDNYRAAGAYAYSPRHLSGAYASTRS